MARTKKHVAKPETLAPAEQRPIAAAEAALETEPGLPSMGVGVPQAGQAPSPSSPVPALSAHDRSEAAAVQAGQALRRRAEQLALDKAPQMPESLEALSPEAARRLLHELWMHQIELEMQNEELRRAQAELEASRARYFDLYDLAPVGCVTLSEQGLILQANLIASTLLGVARGALAKQRLIHFILPEDQGIYYLHRKLLFETGAPQSCELRMLRAGGAPFWARLDATAAQEAGGAPVCRAVLSDISARKQAQEALQRREREFSTLVENAPDLIVRFDANLRYVYCNAAVEHELGLSPKVLLGKTLVEVGVPREQAEFVEQTLRKILESGQEQEVEQSGLSPSGPKVYLTRIVPERDGQGRIESLLAISRDITTRKRAEEALRESESKFHSFVSLCEDAIILTDEQGLVIEWNRGAETLLGLDAQEALGQPLWDLQYRSVCDEDKTPERYQRMKAGLQASYLAGHAMLNQLSEVTIQRPDGTRRDVQGRATCMPTQRGIAMGSIIRDVSARKQAEQALRVSEERYRNVARLSSDFAYSCIQQGAGAYQVDWITDAFFSITGYSETELEQKKCWMFVSHAEDAEFATEPLRRLRAGEKDTREFRIVSKDGHVLWVQNAMECVADPQTPGKTSLIGAVRDITEFRRAEQERLEMQQRLLQSQKLESLGVLAGGIAHDFNNLLMAMLGNLELAAEDLSPLSSARPRVEQAVLAAKRAADLTRQMLAYSGKGRFVVSDVDLSELVEENAHMLRAAIPHSITFGLHLGKHLPPILADAGQVQQVVMNLITNASEAVGEVPGIVALATGVQACDEDYLSRSLLEDKPAPGSFVWLEVTDTGCGMDEETLQRMFEPFFTTKFTGRGLGMSAMHGIVRGHQGAILIDSQVGKGTTVRVLFPAAERPAVQPRLRQDATQPAEAAVTGGEAAREAKAAALSGTLLVVDDELMVCELCAATLTNAGFQVLTAADGEEAVALFRAHADEIGCVLLDLTMPGMDGVAAFEAMRSIRPDVRVILCSGYDEQQATQRFAGLGLAGFLHKPFELKSLRAELQRVLGPPSEFGVS